MTRGTIRLEWTFGKSFPVQRVSRCLRPLLKPLARANDPARIESCKYAEHGLKSFSTRHVSFAVVGVLVLSCTACQGKKFYPVHGSVLVNGQPGKGITIVFHPQGDANTRAVMPQATTGDDGSFELRSWLVDQRITKDGAPPGNYVVTCIWLPENYTGMGIGNLPDRLHGKYSTIETSKLQATIPEKPTELPPFELEAPKK